jgi:predicted deacylase
MTNNFESSNESNQYFESSGIQTSENLPLTNIISTVLFDDNNVPYSLDFSTGVSNSSTTDISLDFFSDSDQDEPIKSISLTYDELNQLSESNVLDFINDIGKGNDQITEVKINISPALANNLSQNAVDIDFIDNLLPTGLIIPSKSVGVSEDNVPNQRDFSFALTSKPNSNVTLNFTVDEQQIEPVESITFTPDDWFEIQTSGINAVKDEMVEGDSQISEVKVEVVSEDPNYNGLDLENIPVQITDSTIPGFASYRTVEKTYEDLSQLAQGNPNIANWIDIGDSYEKTVSDGKSGYDIFELNLTNKDTNDLTDKPDLFIQASTHGNEYTPTEAVTRFAEQFVSGYERDPDITWLLDYVDIHIVPVVNPDGRKLAEQGYPWRKNTNPNAPEGVEPAVFPDYGVDLNRNYDFEWGQVPGGSSGEPANPTYRGEFAFSEPETKALRDRLFEVLPTQPETSDSNAAFQDSNGVYLDIHSFGNEVLYPSGSTTEPTLNDEGLRNFGSKLSYFTGENGEPYDVKQSFENGATDGASEDWVYETFGIPAYTLELGTEFFEDRNYFEDVIIPEVLPALKYSAKATNQPYQVSAGPDSIEVHLETEEVVTGKPITINAVADSTRYSDGDLDSGRSSTESQTLSPFKNINAARYSIDTPSWVEGAKLYSLSAADGTFDTSVEELVGSIDTTELASGSHTVFIESQNEDGTFGAPTAIFFNVIEAPEESINTFGTEEKDTLEGEEGNNLIEAFAGDDLIFGEADDDILFGGHGNDELIGDNSSAITKPICGSDRICGGPGDDLLNGQNGNDSLYGDEGNDRIYGGTGDDLLDGGLGNDTLAGNDLKNEGSSTFVISEGEGTDTITDFEIETDFIGLTGTLNYEQLQITQDKNNVLIGNAYETMAIIEGVQANNLSTESFLLV